MRKNIIFKIVTNPAFILLLLLVINIIIVPFIPMNNDEGMWSYIGRVWSQNGIPPYRGTIENKTPGIFELHAISNILFGVNVFFVRGLGILAVLISSFTIYLIGKKIKNHLSGVFSMYLFALTSTWGLVNGVFISHTEVFMVMFSTLSIYLVIKGIDSLKWRYWLLVAGISMGFAIAFKQIAIATTLALILFYLYTSSNRTNQNKFIGIILLGTGILVSTMLSILPLLLSGVTVKEYVEGAWLILFNSGSSSSAITHLAGFLNIFVYSRFILFYPFLFLIIGQRKLLKNHLFIGLLIWLFFDFIGVNSSGYYYGHQIRQIFPSLSLLIGILLSGFLNGLFLKTQNKEKYFSMIIILVILIMLPYKSLSLGVEYILTSKQNDPDKEIGIWLRDHTNKNESVYLIDNSCASILSYSERLSSSKYFNSIFITTDMERNMVLDNLVSNPPSYILRHNSKTDNPIYLGPKIENLIQHTYTFQEKKYYFDILKKD